MWLWVDRDHASLSMDKKFANEFGCFPVNDVGQFIYCAGGQIGRCDTTMLSPVLQDVST